MDCRICELKQRQFICETCLKTHLHDLQQQIHYYSTDRDEQVTKASKVLLNVVIPARTTRGGYANVQYRMEELQVGLSELRKDNDQKRDQLRMLRETLSTRRRNLSAAKLHISAGLHPSTSSLHQSSARVTASLTSLSAAISRARAGLVQELVEVFNVVEVGGRPPIGGKAGTKGEWTIGDLILPVPGDMRRYPPDHINAVLTHTTHFLSLLTFYLGVKLPFEVAWSGGKIGLGHSWIGATKGTETGGWARWHTKHPLHLSSSPNPVLPPSSPSTPETNTKISEATSLSSSVVAAAPPSTAPQSSFTTALAMLVYNVCYLAHTQNVDVPLNQAGDVLSNLWMVCCSAELGRKSHETHPHLPPPTPPSFPLDFSQLLMATSANPASKARRPVNLRTGKISSTPGRHVVDEVVPEEDEGWDLVDDDV